jgi:hypothetical protein
MYAGSAFYYENLSLVEDKMALNTQIVSGEDEPRYVSHPTGHTNSVSGEGEPRYVSHPAAHSNAVVFRRNTGSDTDNIHLAVSVNAHFRVESGNVRT